MERKLEKLKIKGFKSVRDQELRLGNLNVFIGGNGSGKSNLIEVFRFLREILSENLQQYTAQKGGADALLYFGRKTTDRIYLFLEYSEGLDAETSNSYQIELAPTDEDSLYVAYEDAYYHERRRYHQPFDLPISRGGAESKLRRNVHIAAQQIASDLQEYLVYHFHDTSDSAPMRGTSDVEDNRYLRPKAENLAAFLYYLQQAHGQHFRNIESATRLVAPFFDKFRLSPSRLNAEKIRLEWAEKGDDGYFGPSALSDGTLRFICLATLLLQPTPPRLVLLDEPELGLHPAAINVLAGLLRSASANTQIVAATQSVTLVNQLELSELWAVDREEHQSTFRSLRDADMSAWLDEYSIGDLWEKNLLGARP
ncbi:MAG TPA: AAA family ATPase [Reyranella sp.]|nr:AAA family ATPase [Reyranella sp.]